MSHLLTIFYLNESIIKCVEQIPRISKESAYWIEAIVNNWQLNIEHDAVNFLLDNFASVCTVRSGLNILLKVS